MRTYTNLIKNHIEHGPQESIIQYLDAYQKKQSDELAYLIGVCYAQLSKHDKALEYFNNITDISHQVLTAQANAYLSLNQIDNAKCALDQSLQKQANNPNAYATYGRLHMTCKAYDQAVTYLSQAIELDPKVADYHYNLGLAFQRQYKIDMAAAAFAQAVALEPTHYHAWRLYALCHEIKTSYASALDAYKKSWSISEHPDTAHGLGRTHSALSDYDEALLYFNRAITLGETSLECHHNLASIYHIKGLDKQALIHWHYCLERHNTFEYRYNIACAYQNTQNYDQAKCYFDSCLKEKPGHIDSLLNLAAIALDEHQKERATQLYKQILDIDPNCTDAKFIYTALTGQSNVSDKAPTSYIKSLFNQYAGHYDKHLKSVLHYQLPAAIDELIIRLNLSGTDTCLDLGCGTGLIGEVLKPYVGTLIGIDLSDDMLQAARNKNIYSKLIACDILETPDDICADLIIAADVLPYFGNVESLFAVIDDRLSADGVTIFSFEHSDSHPYALHQDVRFAHSQSYIESCIKACGWDLIEISAINLRKQQGKAVNGYLVACRASIST